MIKSVLQFLVANNLNSNQPLKTDAGISESSVKKVRKEKL